jgi:CRP-like cAMP-binding protein
MAVTPELLKRIPMFHDLHEAEIAAIIGCFDEASIAAGETLYAEGDAATSACFLIDGELEALKALPGGGAAQVGVIGPGGMIGEMALVAGGSRSATVRALTKCTILSVSYYFFHAALDQMSAPAFKILRSVILSLTRRLEELQGRILEQWDCEAYSPPSHAATPERGLFEEAKDRAPSFDYRPFLPVVSFFASFTESEIDRVAERAKVLELPRGEFLYREGAPAQACYVLVRGAVEISVLRDRRYQLSILGPGRLCGANALIAEAARGSDARVRSAALFLCFDGPAFESLYLGETTECLKFQNMISANQLQELKTADNLLTTLVSQDYVLEGARSRGT